MAVSADDFSQALSTYRSFSFLFTCRLSGLWPTANTQEWIFLFWTLCLSQNWPGTFSYPFASQYPTAILQQGWMIQCAMWGKEQQLYFKHWNKDIVSTEIKTNMFKSSNCVFCLSLVGPVSQWLLIAHQSQIPSLQDRQGTGSASALKWNKHPLLIQLIQREHKCITEDHCGHQQRCFHSNHSFKSTMSSCNILSFKDK